MVSRAEADRRGFVYRPVPALRRRGGADFATFSRRSRLRAQACDLRRGRVISNSVARTRFFLTREHWAGVGVASLAFVFYLVGLNGRMMTHASLAFAIILLPFAGAIARPVAAHGQSGSPGFRAGHLAAWSCWPVCSPRPASPARIVRHGGDAVILGFLVDNVSVLVISPSSPSASRAVYSASYLSAENTSIPIAGGSATTPSS